MKAGGSDALRDRSHRLAASNITLS